MTTSHHVVSDSSFVRVLAERFVRRYEEATEALSHLSGPRARILSAIHRIDEARYEASRELLREYA